MMRTCRIAARIREAGFALLLAFALAHPAASQAPAGQSSGQMPEMKQKALETYGKLPLRFEANRGQSDAQVRFLARGSGYTLYLTATEAVLALRQGQANSPGVLRMRLIGANPAPRVAGLEKLPGAAHYFIGNDPKTWRTDIPTFAKVEYRDVYPGVNLVYYGNEGRLEYDFVVSPGADPGTIRVAFEGADSLAIDAQGDLVLRTAAGDIRQRKPLIYQEVDGVRREISGGYVLKERDQIAFHVAAYDASRPLVIDPVLSYSTYLGGSGFSDEGKAIAVDGFGNAYVTGVTDSTDFRTTAGAFDTTCGTDGTCNFSTDAYVAKFDASGALVYATYLGGNSAESGLGIAVDGSGNVYVTGFTFSTDFPTTLSALQRAVGGSFSSDAFVTKLNATGGLVYSTYLGGNNFDEGKAVAVDAGGNAYVTGSTFSPAFPGAAAVRPYVAGFDAFVAKLNAVGSGLVYFTYLGGSSSDAGLGIAVDGSGNAYVAGSTDSADFPVVSAFQSAAGGAGDAFVTKLNAFGGVAYSTYLGGSGGDEGRAIAVDGSGNAYVTGFTGSTNFPTAGAFQATPGGMGDAFVTKLNASGTLAYSTYLGGGGSDGGNGIAVDASGNAYVTGFTDSTNFPTAAAVQAIPGGMSDAFVAKFSAAGSALLYSTYLGGSSLDAGQGIAVDGSGHAHVTGITYSVNFPTKNPSQPIFGGQFGSEAFVARIDNPATSSMVPFASFNLQVELDDDDDGIDLDAFKARFTLGAASNGIDPPREDVVIQVGSSSVTIPAGSFRQDRKGRFKYEGLINGVRVKASIRSSGGGSFKFKVKAEESEREGHHRRDRRDGDPPFWWSQRRAGAASPITVALTIGNDSGTTTWSAKAGHRRTGDRGRDD